MKQQKRVEKSSSEYTMSELVGMVRECAEREAVKSITSAADVYSRMIEFADKKQEHVFCMTLDGASKIIEVRTIFIGTVNQSLVHPREVFVDAISDRAVGIILIHNHPSGALEPSQADNTITKRIKEASKIIGIELLDHVIISRKGFYSYQEEGLL